MHSTIHNAIRSFILEVPMSISHSSRFDWNRIAFTGDKVFRHSTWRRRWVSFSSSGTSLGEKYPAKRQKRWGGTLCSRWRRVSGRGKKFHENEKRESFLFLVVRVVLWSDAVDLHSLPAILPADPALFYPLAYLVLHHLVSLLLLILAFVRRVAAAAAYPSSLRKNSSRHGHFRYP